VVQGGINLIMYIKLQLKIMYSRKRKYILIVYNTDKIKVCTAKKEKS